VTSIPDVWLVAPAQIAVGEPDPALVGRALDREEAALAALYARYAPMILRFLRNLLGDPATAADATQETFSRAFRRLDSLRDEERMLPWLFGIARKVSLEHRRAQRTRRRVFSDEGEDDDATACDARVDARTPEAELLGREAARVLSAALGRLSDDRRAMLLLRLDHGLAYEDIAQLMGFSVAKVKVEIHRARQVLRAELTKYQGDPT